MVIPRWLSITLFLLLLRYKIRYKLSSKRADDDSLRNWKHHKLSVSQLRSHMIYYNISRHCIISKIFDKYWKWLVFARHALKYQKSPEWTTTLRPQCTAGKNLKICNMIKKKKENAPFLKLGGPQVARQVIR
jgi:hypothetical protein